MEIKPDLRSKSDLELLRLSVESRACGAFLYRIEDRIESEELADHVIRLARAYATEAPFHVVKVCGEASSRARGDAVRSLLSALLHCEHSDILLIFGCYLAPNQKSGDTLDEDEFGPSEKIPNAPTLFTSEGDRVLRLLPYIPATIVVPIAASTQLRARDARLFLGAIDPIRMDRQALKKSIQTLDPMVSDENAANLAELWHDPQEMAANLARLHDVAKAASRIGCQSDGLGAVNTRSDENASFNPILRRCVRSLAPHMHGCVPPSSRGDKFVKELFVGQPDPDLLWNNGAELVRAGAFIGLFGISGTGKTAAARAIIRDSMQLGLFERRPSDLIFRHFGESEKAIKRAFARARAENLCLLFDEAESVVAARAEYSGNTAHAVTALTTTFLTELDNHELPLVFISNHRERIDPAVLRRIHINVEVEGLTDALEAKAWETLVGVSPPSDWLPSSNCTISDFMHAKKLARLTGDWGPEAIRKNIETARNARLGRDPKKRRIGFAG